MAQKGEISRVVIDEAHVIIQWGYSFRESYIYLLRWCKEHQVKITFLSASISEEARFQILHAAEIHCTDVTIMRGPSFRENLALVAMKFEDKDRMEMVLRGIIRQHFVDNRERGVIFCLSKEDVKYYRDFLDEMHIHGTMFHADYSPFEKQQKLKYWLSAEKPSILVSTVAFSMGVDVPDIGFVIHSSLPGDLAGWYQEFGRAGRNGNRATCYVLWKEKDIARRRFLISKSCAKNELDRRRALEDLYFVRNILEDKGLCIWKKITARFSPNHVIVQCNRCSACSSEKQERNYTELSGRILTAFEESNLGLTIGETVQIMKRGRPSHIEQPVAQLQRIGQRETNWTLQNIVELLVDMGKLELGKRQGPILRQVLRFKERLHVNEDVLLMT